MIKSSFIKAPSAADGAFFIMIYSFCLHLRPDVVNALVFLSAT